MPTFKETATEGGFSIIPNWVIRDSNLTGNEILVYIALLNRANSKGLAWPATARIAKESRTSLSTVKRTIKSLEGRGLLTKQLRPRGDGSNDSNVYHVAMFERTPPGPNHPFIAGRGVQGEPGRGPQGTNPGSSVDRKEDTQEEDPIEEDLRSELLSGRALSFIEIQTTNKQVQYLHDLFIHFNNEAPSNNLTSRWEAMSKEEATNLINQYLAQIPRYDEYEGPDSSDPAFEALSETGKQWAETGMIPV